MENVKPIILDTNILLQDVSILSEPNLIIPLVVLQELDRQKTDPNIGFEARRAVRAIKESNVKIDINFASTVLNNDDLILECAKANNGILYTRDISLGVKATSFGIENINPHSDSDKVYTGVIDKVLSNTEMARMYSNANDNVFDMHVNQYVLIRNDSGICVDKLRWNGSKLVALRLPPSKVVKPLNDLQACALDLLNDKDIPIKILAGTYGSGKSILNIRMALWNVLTKGSFSKILVVRNPIGAGEEIGFLKGDKDDKIAHFYKPIEQNLEGGEIQLQNMIRYGQLEYDIPWFIKGQSISNTWIMVDEAEDMNKKLIKLIGTRIAENSCICFSGDWKQAEPKYIRDNGLVYLLNQTKDNPLVGGVVMDMDVRSEASKVFADLD